MNSRAIVVAVSTFAIAVFALAAAVYKRNGSDSVAGVVAQESNTLVRPHSPIIGRSDAPVTIVEFFDPACEACRAFYPIVKKIIADSPNDVRLVLRYTAFHKGSDAVVKMLEAARAQGVFLAVLEAVIAAQPEWADHGRPQIDKAWAAAAKAGLNVETAQKAILTPAMSVALMQDSADVRSVGVRQTPTFFVNGKPLIVFGAKPLQDLVRSEVDAVRKK